MEDVRQADLETKVPLFTEQALQRSRIVNVPICPTGFKQSWKSHFLESGITLAQRLISQLDFKMYALEIINTTNSFNTEIQLAGSTSSHHTLSCNAKSRPTPEDTVYRIALPSIHINRCFPFGINEIAGIYYYLSNFFCIYKNEWVNKMFLNEWPLFDFAF